MQRTTLTEELRAITGFDSDDLSDSDLSFLISASLNEYLLYRPGLQLTAAADGITTVDDQPNYALPDDALWIVEVGWNPDTLGSGDDLSSALDDLYLRLSLEGFDPNHPSELHVIYGRLAEYRTFFQGHWKVINGEIWLIPCPTQSGDHVAVYYAKARTLADLNAIKDQRFFNLVQSAMLIRRGNDLMGEGSWRAGSLAVDNTRLAESFLKRGQDLRRDTLAVIANPYYAERSGPGLFIKSE